MQIDQGSDSPSLLVTKGFCESFKFSPLSIKKFSRSVCDKHMRRREQREEERARRLYRMRMGFSNGGEESWLTCVHYREKREAGGTVGGNGVKSSLVCAIGKTLKQKLEKEAHESNVRKLVNRRENIRKGEVNLKLMTKWPPQIDRKCNGRTR